MRLSEMAGLNKMHSVLKGLLNIGRAQYIRIENNAWHSFSKRSKQFQFSIELGEIHFYYPQQVPQ